MSIFTQPASPSMQQSPSLPALYSVICKPLPNSIFLVLGRLINSSSESQQPICLCPDILKLLKEHTRAWHVTGSNSIAKSAGFNAKHSYRVQSIASLTSYSSGQPDPDILGVQTSILKEPSVLSQHPSSPPSISENLKPSPKSIWRTLLTPIGSEISQQCSPVR